MASHRHDFLYRKNVDKPWKLHRLFRNPKVKVVLVGCSVCYPKKELKVRKVGRVLSFEGVEE